MRRLRRTRHTSWRTRGGSAYGHVSHRHIAHGSLTRGGDALRGRAIHRGDQLWRPLLFLICHAGHSDDGLSRAVGERVLFLIFTGPPDGRATVSTLCKL